MDTIRKAREYNTGKNRKDKVLNTRVSETEKDKLLKMSQKLNMSPSDTVRFAIKKLIDNN
jgi:antitoxin component of RelBE/YafQ-DinJ toxin-antitoxin module